MNVLLDELKMCPVIYKEIMQSKTVPKVGASFKENLIKSRNVDNPNGAKVVVFPCSVYMV